MSTAIPTPAISQEAALATTSKSVVDANPNRSFLSITNTSDVDVSLAFGTTAVDGSGITLGPGQGIQITVDRQALAWEGWKTLEVFAIANSGTGKTLSIFDASFTG